MRRAVVYAAVAAVVVFTSAASPALAALGDCGQPQSTGTDPKTSDALAALRTAVGNASACDDEPCVCDVNANGSIQTSDALAILRVAVGQTVALNCDCGCTLLGGSTLVDADHAAPLGALGPNQIQVEVKFVEVTTAAANELGFDWLTNTVQIAPDS